MNQNRIKWVQLCGLSKEANEKNKNSHTITKRIFVSSNEKYERISIFKRFLKEFLVETISQVNQN